MGDKGAKIREKTVAMRVWDRLISKLDGGFVTIMEFHVGSKLRKSIRETVEEDPSEFREAFVKVFGEAGWLLFARILSETCLELGEDLRVIEEWFGFDAAEVGVSRIVGGSGEGLDRATPGRLL